MSWFDAHRAHWDAWLAPWLDKRDAVVLEIGSFAGDSAEWLAHHAARVVCVDDWSWGTAADFAGKVARMPANVVALTGRSDAVLPLLADGIFDLVYVDGGHDVPTVAHDSRHALRLVRRGGLVLWDDFWPTEHTAGCHCAEVREGVERALSLGQLQRHGNAAVYYA